jgi:hypothetical protein
VTSPREPIAWEGKPITLWRGDHYEGDSFFLSESKHQRREEWKALPVDAYAALVAERDALREKAERALNEVTCLRMSLRALSSLHPTHDVEYARTAAKRHEDNSWARYPVDAYGTALGAERG